MTTSVVSTRLACQIARVSRETLWGGVRSGMLSEPVRISTRRRYWNRAEITAFAEFRRNLAAINQETEYGNR